MENVRNERLKEIIKENERIMVEFINDLTKRLEEKSINIDGVESIMLKTFEAMKRGVIAATEEVMSEEGKKKLK